MGRQGSFAVLLLVGAAGCLPAAAATVTVVARDSEGVRLEGEAIDLNDNPDGEFPREGAPPTPTWLFRAHQSARTGADGKVVFQNVPAGSYQIDLPRPNDPNLVPPSQNPLAPPTRFTVVKPDERLAVDLVISRGWRIVARLDVGRAEIPRTTVGFQEQAAGAHLESRLRDDGYAERILPPGRWEVSLDPPGGFLLKDFEEDGFSLPGFRTLLDVDGGPRTVYLTWHYDASCRIHGTLSWDTGDRAPATIVAKLVRPGGWIEEATRRGGSVFDEVDARMEPNGRYEILLPDGAWRLGPAGEHLLSSTPESVDLDLSPGDDRTVDFSVTAEPSEPASSSLSVMVDSPGHRTLADASVAIFPITGGSAAETAIKRGATGPGGEAASIRGLPSGDYLAVAGHEGFVEGSAEVHDFEADGPHQGVVVRLGRGATISVLARDERDAPAKGIELIANRTGDPPPSRLGDPDLTRRRAHRQTTTDETGRAKIVGLDPGLYTLQAAFSTSRPATHFLRFVKDGKPVNEKLDLALEPDGTASVEIRLVPAASLGARLVCSDGGPLPSAASLRLLAPEVELSERAGGSSREGERRSETATGPALDTSATPAPAASGGAAPAAGTGSGRRPPSRGARETPAGTRPRPSADPRNGPDDAGRSPSSDREGLASESEDRRAPREPPPTVGTSISDTPFADAVDDPVRGAVYRLDEIKLTGRGLDTLRAGPFREGEYVLAIRPRGFDRWTYAPGTEETPRAVPIVLETGKTADLGLISVDCGPTVRILPEVLSHAPLPDLRDAGVETTVARLESSEDPGGEASRTASPSGAPRGSTVDRGASPGWETRGGSGRGGWRKTPAAERVSRRRRTDGAAFSGDAAAQPPSVERAPARVRLRGLPEGEVGLSLTLTHPFFMPETTSAGPFTLRLERGREAWVRVPVQAIGGAIEIDVATALGARGAAGGRSAAIPAPGAGSRGDGGRSASGASPGGADSAGDGARSRRIAGRAAGTRGDATTSPAASAAEPAETAGTAPGAEATALATGLDGKKHQAISSDGLARIGGLAPGLYRVDLCADAECLRIARTWRSVEVGTAAFTRLP